MKVSIVVPAFNEEKLLPRTLDSIGAAMAAFSQRGWESELIVCDNNSTDGTASLARAAGAAVVFEPVNQIARARNKGAQAASGDWLIFIDADSYPSSELFAQAAQAIEAGECLYGGCTVALDTSHPLLRIVNGVWNAISRVSKYAAGSFIFCEADAFRRIGGFDNRLFAGEEIDLSQRLKRLARGTGKKAVILHRYPLVTSGRKFGLYSWREHLSLMLRCLFGWRRLAVDREGCYMWYDGRR